MSKFEARYVVKGVRGDLSLQTFKIDSSDLYDDMDAADILALYDELVYEDFKLSVCPEADRVKEFLAWANNVIDESED